MKKVRKRINRNYDYASIYRFTQVEIEEALLMYLEQNRAETIDGGKSRKLIGLKTPTKEQRKKQYHIYHPLTLVIDTGD